MRITRCKDEPQIASELYADEHQDSHFHHFFALGDNYEMGESQNVHGHCRALTKAGKPCSARATDCGYCNIHSRPGRAAELGRLGGRRNRHTAGSDASRGCHPPASAPELQEILAEAIADVRCGRVDPRIGNAIAYMATPLLKAFETAELEQRLLNIEEELKGRQ